MRININAVLNLVSGKVVLELLTECFRQSANPGSSWSTGRFWLVLLLLCRESSKRPRLKALQCGQGGSPALIPCGSCDSGPNLSAEQGALSRQINNPCLKEQDILAFFPCVFRKQRGRRHGEIYGT
jgi:hypothetical protein